MTILTKSIYGCQFDAKKTPFGLLNQQIRTNSVMNNAGWFNGLGERLGAGDLSMEDIGRVAAKIGKTEKFIVLTEFDTSWSIPSDLESSAPGIDYVMENCVWHITSNRILRIIRDGEPGEATRDGIKYNRMHRDEFFKLVGYSLDKNIDVLAKIVKKASVDWDNIVDKVVADLGKIHPTKTQASPPVFTTRPMGTLLQPGKKTTTSKTKAPTKVVKVKRLP